MPALCVAHVGLLSNWGVTSMGEPAQGDFLVELKTRKFWVCQDCIHKVLEHIHLSLVPEVKITDREGKDCKGLFIS